MIYLSTNEGIYVWKTATDPDKLLERIALTVENRNKFLARMKRNFLSFESTNSPKSRPPGTAFHQTYEEVRGTILANIESFCITTTNSLKIKSPR